MIVQAMIETINGCKILLRGSGLTQNELNILDVLTEEELKLIRDSNALEVHLMYLQEE
jgi:hypothetical protein